ncbi:DNA circularization protein [Pandoraea sp.]|uniref:DNA circularization protein n=1 Tax=Pandoraea sp. TaxID=1883445 RepID=UPI0035B14B10
MDIGSGAGALLGASTGITNLANSLATRLGGTAPSYFSQLRNASFRGVHFVSLGSDNSFGRRKQVHEYPQRDTQWVEDLGRGLREFRMFGFVVGDDVIAQRDALIAACETAGDGELVHPTLGRRRVSLMNFHSVERWEKGRYFEFQFVFVENGSQVFPSVAAATKSLVERAADALDLSAELSFTKDAVSALASSASDATKKLNAALEWANTATGVVTDARNLFNVLTNLPGDFGRFLGSSATPSFSKFAGSDKTSVSATSASLTESATNNRVAVASAAATLVSAAQSLDQSNVAAFATATQSLSASVLAATTTPADAVRLLSTMVDFTADGQTDDSVVGAASATLGQAMRRLFRRAAIGSISRASASYLPSSHDDAVSMRDRVTTLIDAELSVAGDQGEDDAYGALCSLRAAVIVDLNQRGAALASIKTYTLPGSLPVLALAHRLYRDASRADELTAQVNPVHPAFMPSTFKADSK